MTTGVEMKLYVQSLMLVFGLCALPFMVMADESGLSFSVRVLGGNWSGKNKTSDTEFQSTEGSQLAFSGLYQYRKFYTGLNLQGGEYTFEENTPDQVTPAGRTEISNDKITHNELDLIFGYYLTTHVSLFLDFKTVTNTWESNSYEQKFGGAALGVTGNWPVAMNWQLYGSLGRISAGEITTNDQKIGKGSSTGIELGALYQFSKQHRVIFGFKGTNYYYKFDSGDEQNHTINGAFLGYNYAFALN